MNHHDQTGKGSELDIKEDEIIGMDFIITELPFYSLASVVG